VASIIVAVAIVVVPATTPGPSEDGTFKFIIKISSPSTMSSSTTVMFTVLLLVPAVIVAVCDAESKSTLLPKLYAKFCQQSHDHSLKAKVLYIHTITYI